MVTAPATSTMWLALSAPCATFAACSWLVCCQTSSSTASDTIRRVGVDETRPGRPSIDEERRAGAGGSRDDDVGDAHAAPRREQQRVGLVLDVFESRQVEARPAVLVQEEAPQLRHELRVGFVASEHAHVEWPVVVFCEHQGRAPGLAARELDIVRGDAELLERGTDLRARRASTG